MGDTEIIMQLERATMAYGDELSQCIMLPFPFHVQLNGLRVLLYNALLLMFIIPRVVKSLYPSAEDVVNSSPRKTISIIKARHDDEEADCEINLSDNYLTAIEIRHILEVYSEHEHSLTTSPGQRKSGILSSERLFAMFNIINVAWNNIREEVMESSTSSTSLLLIRQLDVHVCKFITPFNLFNHGDGRSFLNNLVYYLQFFTKSRNSKIAIAMSVSLHKYMQWKDVDWIMDTYLSNVKLCNELNIELFQSCIQRQLPNNIPYEFNVVKNVAERAGIGNKSKNDFKSYLSLNCSDNVDKTDSLLYEREANKDAESVRMTEDIIRQAFEYIEKNCKHKHAPFEDEYDGIDVSSTINLSSHRMEGDEDLHSSEDEEDA